MHIASGLALVRRDPAQSDVGARAWRLPRLEWVRTVGETEAVRPRVRKILPGAILLMVLVVLGALFPIVF
jgi:hypothetical protein